MYLLKDLDKINPLLSKYYYENIEVVGRMRNTRDFEIIVDDLDNPKGFLFISEDWCAPFAEDTEVLVKLLHDYEFPNNVDFCGIPTVIAEKIIEALPDYQVAWREECYLYYLPEENYSLYKSQSTKTLDVIREEDLIIVNENYTYKDEDSLIYLKECISNQPSTMIRDEKGIPISWALVREDNSMGVMFTVKAHRKKGLAMEVSKDLIKKVIESKFTPYVHIVVDNTPSISLAKELGMIQWGSVLWFGIEKK